MTKFFTKKYSRLNLEKVKRKKLDLIDLHDNIFLISTFNQLLFSKEKIKELKNNKSLHKDILLITNILFYLKSIFNPKAIKDSDSKIVFKTIGRLKLLEIYKQATISSEDLTEELFRSEKRKLKKDYDQILMEAGKEILFPPFQKTHSITAKAHNDNR